MLKTCPFLTHRHGKSIRCAGPTRNNAADPAVRELRQDGGEHRASDASRLLTHDNVQGVVVGFSQIGRGGHQSITSAPPGWDP